jgi:Zn-dependent protease
MRDQTQWSVSLGTWAGVRVRLHMYFFVFAALTLYLGWLSQQQHGNRDVVLALTSLGLLALATLFHELGHCYAAGQLGSAVEQIVLWPLGGLAPLPQMVRADAEWKAYLAGPLASFLVCLLCLPLLAALHVDNALALVNPLRPPVVDGQAITLADVVKLAFWINATLGLVNLIPCFPFDGGRALRSALLAGWPGLGRPAAGLLVARFAQAAAIVAGAVLLLWLVRDISSPGLTPTWFALALLAILVFFSAKQEEHHLPQENDDDDFFGYDFSQGYTSLERSQPKAEEPSAPRPGLVARWLSRRRQERLRQQQEQEQADERHVDEVLARLHQHGIDSLTPEDRALLERVSARYRNRMGNEA